MCALAETKGLHGSFHEKGQHLNGCERVAASTQNERKATTPDLLRIAEARTPGCHTSMWGAWNRKRCVLTLGSEDLRIYVAYHKPPMVFPLSRVRVRCGRSHLELSRANWTVKLLRYFCCCEPLTMLIKLRRSQVQNCCRACSPCTAWATYDRKCRKMHAFVYRASRSTGRNRSVGQGQRMGGSRAQLWTVRTSYFSVKSTIVFWSFQNKATTHQALQRRRITRSVQSAYAHDPFLTDVGGCSCCMLASVHECLLSLMPHGCFQQ